MIRPTERHVISVDQCAVIVPALSVSVFFDVLSDEQLSGLEAAWLSTVSLLGKHLRWYMTDSMAERRPLRKDILAHVPEVLRQVAKKRPYYFFRAHGGDGANCMHPWAVDLWVDNPRPIVGNQRSMMSAIFKTSPDAIGRLANCLRVSFPALNGAVDPAEVETFAKTLIGEMPILHGNAGYSLLFDSSAPVFEPEHWAGLAQVAMRHPGYDVLQYVDVRGYVYDKIKTVNWLTILGPAIAEDVEKARLADTRHDIDVLEVRGNLCIKAGPEPCIGDVSIGDTLPSYRAVARVCADVTSFDQMEFGGAFDDDLAQKWVRRFNDD